MQSWMMGMVLGIVVTGFLPALPPPGVSLLLLCLLPSSLWWRHPCSCLLSGAACGCLLGVIHGHALLQHRLAEACVARPLVLEGRVASLPVQRHIPGVGIRQGFQFAVDSVLPETCAGPQRLHLYYYSDDALVPGDSWRFGVRLKKPWGLSNPGGFNRQAWFAQQGVDGTGSARGSAPNRRLLPPDGFEALHHRVRQRISSRIDALPLSPPARAPLLPTASRNGP